MIELNHLDYYRLPWNLTDNSISWLEPTAKCNLSCYGCYRTNEKTFKTIAEIKSDLDVFMKFRKSDGVSIAGGEPLLHPNIIDIVKEVKARGLKPIINSNGLALTKELLFDLKRAGVYGFTFHIDSKQNRPGWKEANEIELNELRYHYASMLAEVGNISCSFNSTVYEDTMKYIPDMLKWAHEHIDIVQVMVFILYRNADNTDFDFYVGPKKIDINETVYNESEEEKQRADIKANEVYEIIKKTYPDFDSCAYLNGSQKPDSFKWLLSGRFGTKEKIYGYMGRKAMEIIQVGHHLLFNKYLAYSEPKLTRKGKSMLLLGAFDKRLRKTAGKFLRNPLNLFKRLHYQSLMIIQPVDFLENGRQNMCDGCPDITVWNGELVWSCRMEEQQKYGINMYAFPKEHLNKN
jgi:MoaA/NifB/PqqE/SkfB family radical SAM enzyme